MRPQIYNQNRPYCPWQFSMTIATVCVLSLLGGIAWGLEYPGESSEWQGFTQKTFELAGRACMVITPDEAAASLPWMFYATPPDARSAISKRLLDKGFHIAYMDVEDLYGNDSAVSHWDAFYGWARETLGLAPKPVIAGAEHGSLLLYSWAAQNSDKVACIYAESPWLELKEAAEGEAADALRRNALAANEKNETRQSLTELAAIVGKAAIPIMHVYGEKRPGTAPDKNVQQFYAAYRLAGKGPFSGITVPSASDDKQVDLTIAPVLFMLKHTGQLVGEPMEEPIAAMPHWKVADFVGHSDIFVLDDVLVIEEGNEMAGIVYSKEPPKINYEIVLDAMRLAGGDFFCGLTAPYKDSSFSLVVGGWGGTCVGISSLDWLDAYHNETAKFRSFQDYRWYRIRLRVTEEKIQVWIDGEETVDVEVSGRDIDIRWEMSPTVPLGVATWCTTGAIKNFSIRSID